MWNNKCLLFTWKEGEALNFIDVNSQDGKKMIEMHKEEGYSDDIDYSFVEEKFMEISYENNIFVEISFSHEVGASYFGLNQIIKTKFSHYLLESAEYWVF